MEKTQRRYKVLYIRRPRIARAWGRKTKTHQYYLVFENMADANAVRRAVQRRKHRLDSVWVKPTTEDTTDISVEDASKGLWRWSSQSRQKKIK